MCDMCQKEGELGSDYMECKICKHYFVCMKCYLNKKHEIEVRQAGNARN